MTTKRAGLMLKQKADFPSGMTTKRAGLMLKQKADFPVRLRSGQALRE
jgi:hypothetical protein